MKKNYFETKKHRGRQWSGYSGAYTIDPTHHQAFVDVYNRFRERWEEVELDRNMDLSLHDDEPFYGATIFRSASMNYTESISHPDWRIEIFFRRVSWGLSKIILTDILGIECHYRTPENREDVFEWLVWEKLNYVGNNHYETLKR
jgi:hypothetical protein